jgi:hypothetical protein
MKRSFLLVSLAVLVTAACEKSPVIRQDVVATGARVKFIHAYPDGPTTGVNVLLNDKKLNGGTPTTAVPIPALAFGNTFPSAGSDYSVVTPGSATVKVVVPATSTTPEVVALTAPLTLDDNQYYSVFATGSPTPEAFVLRDEFAASATDAGKTYVRFVNAVPGTSYDIAVRGATPLAANIAYKSATPFYALDAAATTLEFRETATGKVIGSLATTDFLGGRVFTFYTRGVVGRTGAQAPTLAVYRNR